MEKRKDEAVDISSTAIKAFYILSLYLHPVIPVLPMKHLNS